MAHKFSTSYLEDSISLFHQYKRLAEGAMAQVTDEQLFATLDGEMNCIAIVVKHMTGNMRSRFTDFLTSDGEKPDRHRDTEFEGPPQSREAMMKVWEESWNIVFQSLAPLAEEDMTRSIPIRGEAHSVMQAINRQVAHYAYHVRADCVSGQTSLQQTMEGADGAARQIGGVQQKSFEQRTQPTLMKAPDTTLPYKLTSSVSGD